MKAVVLAAGYATRLYPLTLNTPKPLLEIAGRTILDRILDKLPEEGGVDGIVLVSNAKFYGRFLAWKETSGRRERVTVLGDGSTDNDNRLGAVADLAFAAARAGIADDCLVLAGDNLFDFDLGAFIGFFHSRNTDCITTHIQKDREKLKRTGVIELSEDSRVLSFEEKPAEPKTNFAVPPFYIYKKDTLPLLEIFLKEGNDPDAPGNFIPWLLKRKPVSAFLFEGERYDIGNLETYHAAQEVFAGR